MTKQLTVSSYNIELSKHPDQLTQNIKNLSNVSSIICLQEVLRTSDEVFIIDSLQNTLGGQWQAKYFLGDEETEPGILGHGVAILWDGSQYQLESSYETSLPLMQELSWAEKSLECTLGFAGKPMQRRALSVTLCSSEGDMLRATSTHLDSMGGAAHRHEQTRYLLDTLKTREPVHSEVICGDFNTNSLLNRRSEVNRLQRLFNEYGFKEATEDLGWTMDVLRSDFGGNRPLLVAGIEMSKLRLRQKWDYIWTKDLETVSTECRDKPGSDHNPITATMDFSY